VASEIQSVRPYSDDEIGHEYVERLTLAIESHTKSATQRDPKAFAYRKLDFRSAYERHLFYWLCFHPRIWPEFRDWKSGIRKSRIAFENILEVQLFRLLCDESIESKLYVPLKSQALDFLRRIWRKSFARWTLKWMRWNFSAQLQKQSSGEQKTLAIFVSNPKFVRFLAPVLKRSTQPFEFLILPNDFKAKKATEDLQMPSRRMKLPLFRKIQSLSPKSPLRHFFELLEFFEIMRVNLQQANYSMVLTVEGNAAYDELVSRTAQYLKIESVCIQQGSCPIIHTGFRNLSHSKFLVWGEGFAEVLRPFNPNQKFVAVGSHIIRQKNAVDIRGGIAFFLQSPGPLISQAAWESFLDFIVQIAGAYPSKEIFVREHPDFALRPFEKASLSRLKNIQFLSSPKFSLSDVLSRSSISVSIYSTTILESIASGVLPVIYNPTALPRFFPDVEAAGVGYEGKSQKEVLELIDRLLKNPEGFTSFQTARTEFCRTFFSADIHDPIDRILQELGL
jgi:hypothetical protein